MENLLYYLRPSKFRQASEVIKIYQSLSEQKFKNLGLESHLNFKGFKKCKFLAFELLSLYKSQNIFFNEEILFENHENYKIYKNWEIRQSFNHVTNAGLGMSCFNGVKSDERPIRINLSVNDPDDNIWERNPSTNNSDDNIWERNPSTKNSDKSTQETTDSHQNSNLPKMIAKILKINETDIKKSLKKSKKKQIYTNKKSIENLFCLKTATNKTKVYIFENHKNSLSKNTKNLSSQFSFLKDLKIFDNFDISSLDSVDHFICKFLIKSDKKFKKTSILSEIKNLSKNGFFIRMYDQLDKKNEDSTKDFILSVSTYEDKEDYKSQIEEKKIENELNFSLILFYKEKGNLVAFGIMFKDDKESNQSNLRTLDNRINQTFDEVDCLPEKYGQLLIQLLEEKEYNENY